tara:strand:+ start:33 stop:248 length:216 start_codon:yes stop_codon:yes gene_type:complete
VRVVGRVGGESGVSNKFIADFSFTLPDEGDGVEEGVEADIAAEEEGVAEADEDDDAGAGDCAGAFPRIVLG